MEHTATPWVAVTTPKRNTYIKHGIDNITQMMFGPEDINPEANAAFIVKVVNNHDKLVEALREIITAVDQGYECLGDGRYNKLKAALEAVGE